MLCNSLQVLQDFVDEKQAIVSDASMVSKRRWEEEEDLPEHVFLLIVGVGLFLDGGEKGIGSKNHSQPFGGSVSGFHVTRASRNYAAGMFRQRNYIRNNDVTHTHIGEWRKYGSDDRQCQGVYGHAIGYAYGIRHSRTNGNVSKRL